MKNNILKLCLGIVFVLAMATWLNAASTCTETYSPVGSGIFKLIFDWETGSDSTFTSVTSRTTVTGQIIQAITNPDTSDAGESAADNFDITITDDTGLNLFNNALLNRDSTATELALPEHIAPSTLDTTKYEPLIDSKITIAISNVACDSIPGRLIIFWRAK